MNNDTNKFVVSLQVYRSNKAVLRAGLIDVTADLYNSASKIVNFTPVSADVKEGWQELKEFITTVFQEFDQSQLITSDQTMSFIKDSPPISEDDYF